MGNAESGACCVSQDKSGQTVPRTPRRQDFTPRGDLDLDEGTTTGSLYHNNAAKANLEETQTEVQIALVAKRIADLEASSRKSKTSPEPSTREPSIAAAEEIPALPLEQAPAPAPSSAVSAMIALQKLVKEQEDTIKALHVAKQGTPNRSRVASVEPISSPSATATPSANATPLRAPRDAYRTPRTPQESPRGILSPTEAFDQIKRSVARQVPTSPEHANR